jgi:hypothetical protein
VVNPWLLVREYGFGCDCRLPANSYDYRWPSDAIDRRDRKHVEKEVEASEDGYLDIRVKDEATNTRGFRMVDDDLISSLSPLSQLSTRIKVDSTSSTGSCMEKVVHALGSRFSSGSEKDEDKYTAIPGPSSSGQRRSNKLVKKNRKKKSKRLSMTNESSSDHMSTAAAVTAAEEGEGEGGRQVVLVSQKRRLQNHRDSIASLPAGMVFSPPSVGFSIFGEEEGITTITTMGDKSMPNVPGQL